MSDATRAIQEKWEQPWGRDHVHEIMEDLQVVISAHGKLEAWIRTLVDCPQHGTPSDYDSAMCGRCEIAYSARKLLAGAATRVAEERA